MDPIVLQVLAFALLVRSALSSECGLYLAESTIKNAGWGVFAGKHYDIGDRVEQPGIGIPVIDTNLLNEETVLLQYLWRSSVAGGFQEANKVSNFLPGVGALANFHAGLANVMEGGFDLEADSDGGSTAYHNFSFVASNIINAGGELFVGAALVENESQWEDYPSSQDYIRARTLVEGLLDFRDKHPNLTDIQWIDVLYRLKHEMLATEDDINVKQLLPATLEELLMIKEVGVSSGLLMAERGIEWLQEHGYCLDNIREGTSTVQGAGRGAFATRAIAKGSIVLPAPLIPINATAFGLERRGPHNVTIQLLGNYCFGNLAMANDLLFCPLTQTGLINHKSGKPNAAIRWGKPSTNRIDSGMNLLLEDRDSLMDYFEKRGSKTNAPLMLELVALEDIGVGDEIFLDYSFQWESAFNSHKNMAPVTGKQNEVTPAVTYIQKNQHVVLTENLDPAMTYQCRIEPLASEAFRGTVEEEDYRGRPYQDPKNYEHLTKIMFSDNKFATWFPCDVVGTEDGGSTLRVVLHSKGLEKRRIMRRYRNLPKEALRIVKGPYWSQQHHPNAFRHFLPIPDSLFPSRWRPDYARASDLLLGVPDTGIDAELEENFEYNALHEELIRGVKCGNYFAPSNIPEAGFSQYTAVPYAGKGLVIASFMPSIVMPRLYKDDHSWIITDYVWEGKSYRAEYEVGKDMSTEVLGASLANFHPGIVNMKLRKPVMHPVLDACKDPGAGASSDYVGCSFMSNESLQAGEELFISYGDAWFLAREEFKSVPLRNNYQESNQILSSIWSWSTQHTEGEVADLISMVKRSVVKDSRTFSALNAIDSRESLQKVISHNGTAKATMERRSPEWLQEHGQCMDHIFVKRSTIEQAGHGAFSRRFLTAGTTIISSPLIHVWGRETMNVNLRLIDEGDSINPTMQLLNYQFSHPNSSAYFLPINQMIAINHNSERLTSGEAPNARLRWAPWNKKSNYVLQRPLAELQKEKYSTIVMDVIATRDIHPDEEVFIDYGEEWETAWKEHVSNWESPCRHGRMSSLFIAEMNNDKFNVEYHKWSEDHFSVCAKGGGLVSETIKVFDNPTETGNAAPGLDETIYLGDEGFKYSSHDARRVPCKIRGAYPEFKTFEVMLFFESRSEVEIRVSLPENDLDFIPKPYRSDMHLPGAFRHEMKIPDDLFPLHWRDLV